MVEDPVYVMSNSKSTCIIITKIVLAICIIGIILTCSPVMENLKMNIIYEIEMIGGGAIVIWSGFYIWNRYIKSKERESNINS